jgi:putative hemolysin
MLFWEMLIVFLLILLNGFFAMSELAIVSSRKARLEQMAANGKSGARKALMLADDPTGFLSTVQIGITLIGIFAGAYSGATFAEPLAAVLRDLPMFDRSATPIAFTLVVIATTYLSLIIGELVPKRIALNNAEGIACFVAGPMSVVSIIGAPIVWFLRLSTESLLKLLGVKARPDSTVTEEEVKAMIAEGAESGVFEHAERDMIDGVMRLADRNVRSIMVPRTDTVWLAAGDPIDMILDEIRTSGHSRFPLCGDNVDEVIGVLHVKDILHHQRGDGALDIVSAAREPLYVNETMSVLKLLDRFRASSIHMAIVLDEYGAFEGIVTPADILMTIAGDLPEREGEDIPQATQRADCSWLLDGAMSVDQVERVLSTTGIAGAGDYATLAGFALEQFGHIPGTGEAFEANGWRFEIIDLDGRRIDKILATPITNA